MICNWNRETVKVNDIAIDAHGTVAVVTTMYYQNKLVLGYMFTIGSPTDIIPDITEVEIVDFIQEKAIVYHFLPTKMISRQRLPDFNIQAISGYKNYTQAFYDMFVIVDGTVFRREKPLREHKLNTLIEQTQYLINILRDMYAN